MTLGGRLVSFFPGFHLILLVASLILFLAYPALLSFGALLFVIYLVPVLTFRLHDLFWPLKEGKSQLDKPVYSPWWASHQFQLIYHAIPTFEAILRIIPGAYSCWLRLWGSKVGKQVYWTPLVEITNRSLLEVGDGVTFGHRVYCSAHVIAPKPTGLTLYIRRIKIGQGVFIGAGSKFGPGTVIEDQVVVPLHTELTINQRLRKADL